MAIERTALPKQMLYSDFVGGSMIGILSRAFWHPGTADLPLERASPVSSFIQTRLGIRT